MSENANTFRQLHRAGAPLVLPNAWDAASAVLMQQLGAAAVATSSGGAAWSLGSPDGGRLGAHGQRELLSRVAPLLHVPLTVDVENGYSTDSEAVAEFLCSLARAGAAGVNIEDSVNGSIRPAREFSDWLATVRSAVVADGQDLFINARCDSFLLETAESEADVVDRLKRYVDAGADGVFVPGLTDLARMSNICDKVPAPVNVMAGPSVHSVAELAATGVARVSTGTWLAQAAYGCATAMAKRLLSSGTFDNAAALADYGEINSALQ